MTQEQQHLQAISKIIGDFLKEQGGYSNGSETWASGYVRLRTTSRMDWSTPECDNLTFAKHKKLGGELYQKIFKYITDNNLTAVKVHSEHVQWDTYDTFVSFVPEEFKVSLI